MIPRLMRRGVLYTFVAIILLVVIGALFFTETRRSGRDSGQAAADRIQTIDRFIKSFEEDSTRAAYIAGFRSFIAMEQHVASTGDFVEDPSAAFRESFLNGTIDGTGFTIMENSTFNGYVERVQRTAAQQGISLQATVTNVTLWQIDPWAIMVNYTLSYNVSDNRGTSRWSMNTTLTGRVPVMDLRDPLYTASTYGRVPRVVRPTNVTLYVDDAGDANDTTGLQRHFNSSLYVAAGRGPTMLMRFSGNLSDSTFGIESLVDLDELVAQGLAADQAASVVDYQYFNGTQATACRIQEMPERVRVDDESLDIYQVRGRLNYTGCP